MTPLGPSARGTPAAGVPATRTPDTGMVSVSGTARASQSVARALMLLVERLDDMARLAESPGYDAAQGAARDALRQLAARSRDGALLCRLVDDRLVVDGVPIANAGVLAVPWFDALHDRMQTIGAASITVRDGAAPGELLTLARLLSALPTRADAEPPASSGNDTPTTVNAFALGDDPPRELLRSWSVLVTPVARVRTEGARGATPGSVLARLASARSDEAAAGVVTALLDVLDDAQRRGDGAAVDGVARGVMAQLHLVGSGGGRLALESALRMLMRPALLTLLAQRLPHGGDRMPLLQVISRAGDSGVETLLAQLLASDDPLARRAYFDGIVAMDVGSPVLFDLLRDARWFVVRNAAALLGEMHVDGTDTALLPLLRHADERIRIAAARALIRVRTPKALQALHAAITDSNAEVRRLAAAAFGLAGGTSGGIRPPAARLAAALAREADEDVALEMLAALGRLGSADAVQRLLRIAMPGSQEFTSGERTAVARDPWQRIAAMEALVRARGHAMLPAMETLQNDPDREVATAATRLYAAVTTGITDP